MTSVIKSREPHMTIPADAHFLAWATNGDILLRGGQDIRNREWIRKLYLVPTSGIEGYDLGSFVVAGPRGSGKSALVARRAVRMLDEKNQQNVLLKKTPPFVNELAASKIKISADQLRSLTSTRRWTAIWGSVLSAHLACMVLHERGNAKSEQYPTVENLLAKTAKKLDLSLDGNSNLDAKGFLLLVSELSADAHGESIGKSLNRIISSGNDTDTLNRWSDIFIDLIGSSHSEKIYSIHVDAIDEAFSVRGMESDEVKRLQEDDGENSRLAWVASQKGFLISCSLIARDVSNARAYGSVRIEAVQTLSDEDLKTMGTTRAKSTNSALSKILYTASELEEIFYLNVLKSEIKILAESGQKDPEMSLFGFKKIRHSTVYGFDESILHLICRHTFGTPRDLVFLVKSIIDATPVAKLRPTDTEALLTAIDQAAHELCIDWLNNVMPNVSHQLRQSILGIDKNVITLTDQIRIEDAQNAPGLFAQLYSRGMFGIPTKARSNSRYIMKFRAPDGAEHELPSDFKYGALHPALSAYICNEHENKNELENFYSGAFVVGNDLPCPKNILVPKLRLIINEGNIDLEKNDDEGSKTLSLGDPSKFMDGATLERRRIAAELLSSIILCVARQQKNSIEQCNLASEEAYIRNVGLLQSTWGGLNFTSYLGSHVFGESKLDLFGEINKFTGPSLGIKIQQADPIVKKQGLRGEVSEISLCWAETKYSQTWTLVQSHEIEICVNQNRLVIEPS